MAQYGADLEQLGMLRTTLEQQSQVIEHLTTAVRNQLAGIYWDGPAVERFRGEWSSEYEPSLRRLQAALHEAGAEVGRRREAMLQAGI